MTKIEKKAENVILAFWNSHQQERQYWHRDGVAAALREVVYQLQYYNFGECGEDMILDARAILDIADELEAL